MAPCPLEIHNIENTEKLIVLSFQQLVGNSSNIRKVHVICINEVRTRIETQLTWFQLPWSNHNSSDSNYHYY